MEREVIGSVVRAARRRCVWNEALTQGVLSACCVLGVFILILLVGSQLIDWSWTAVALAAGVGIAVRRTAKRAPSPYRAAQVVDARLGLDDALSTALYFVAPGNRKYSPLMRDTQRAMAEGAAAHADPAVAVPIRLPANWRLLGAFALAAAGLLVVRVGIQRQLDLRAPLSELLIDTFSGDVSKRNLARKGPQQQRLPFDPARADTPTVEEHPEEPGTFDPASDAALDTIDVPDVDNSKAGNEKSGKSAGKGEGSEPGDEMAEGEPGDGSEDGAGQQQAGSQERGGASENMKPDKGKPQGGPAVENPSLASKLRDAMSNLLSTLKPKQSSGANQQTPKGQSAQDRGNPQSGAGQKGQSAQSQNRSGSEQAGDSEEGEGSEQAESGQESDGKSQGKGSEERASNSPGSGMGKQDGSKDVKVAEQMEAMGKISEIIGKRSAAVTGEATIEVQTTKQQIRTPYSNNASATHSQGSGEINRDEVPAASQQYVREYFEKVRKPAAGAAAPAKPISQAAPVGTDRTGR